MHIQVNGKHIDVGAALSAHVETQLTAVVTKYIDRAVDAVVTFSKDGHAFRCDQKVHLASGMTATSTAVDNDIYSAFEQGAARVEKQIRRYKRRLKDHHPKAQKARDRIEFSHVDVPDEDGQEDVQIEGDSLIIAEVGSWIETMGVSEAAEQMRGENSDFKVFRSLRSGRINFVYMRKDGNVGWIDPPEQPAD